MEYYTYQELTTEPSESQPAIPTNEPQEPFLFGKKSAGNIPPHFKVPNKSLENIAPSLLLQSQLSGVSEMVPGNGDINSMDGAQIPMDYPPEKVPKLDTVSKVEKSRRPPKTNKKEEDNVNKELPSSLSLLPPSTSIPTIINYNYNYNYLSQTTNDGDIKLPILVHKELDAKCQSVLSRASRLLTLINKPIPPMPLRGPSRRLITEGIVMLKSRSETVSLKQFLDMLNNVPPNDLEITDETTEEEKSLFRYKYETAIRIYLEGMALLLACKFESKEDADNAIRIVTSRAFKGISVTCRTKKEDTFEYRCTKSSSPPEAGKKAAVHYFKDNLSFRYWKCRWSAKLVRDPETQSFYFNVAGSLAEHVQTCFSKKIKNSGGLIEAANKEYDPQSGYDPFLNLLLDKAGIKVTKKTIKKHTKPNIHQMKKPMAPGGVCVGSFSKGMTLVSNGNGDEKNGENDNAEYVVLCDGCGYGNVGNDNVIVNEAGSNDDVIPGEVGSNGNTAVENEVGDDNNFVVVSEIDGNDNDDVIINEIENDNNTNEIDGGEKLDIINSMDGNKYGDS